MIRKIQLRGISRDPSDRMTEDGGCAESLNVFLDNNEILPALSPDDETHGPIGDVTYGLQGFQILYIHKTANYSNYICTHGQLNGIGLIVYDESTDFTTIEQFIDFEVRETVKCVTSIGNTLIVSTDKEIHYAIYSENKYTYVGTHPPFPNICFVSQVTEPAEYGTNTAHGYYTVNTGLDLMSSATWRSTDPSTKEQIDAIKTQLRSRINTMISGRYYYPFFIRYALKMFDGSYMSYSVPILVGLGGHKRWIEVSVEKNGTASYSIHIRLYNIFSLSPEFKGFDIGEWKRYILSLDVFMSEPVLYFSIDDDIVGTRNPHENSSGNDEVDLVFGPQDGPEESENQKIEAELLRSSSVFYKISSTKIDDIDDDFELQIDWDKYLDVDYLVTQDTLPDDYMSQDTIIPNKAVVYNNRLLMADIMKKLGTGYTFNNSSSVIDTADNDGNKTKYILQYKYFVRNSDGSDSIVCGKYYDGTNEFLPETGYDTDPGGQADKVYETPFAAWIVYPNPKCYKVIITETHDDGGETFTRYYRLQMKEHPYLNCAYGHVGLDALVTSRYLESATAEERTIAEANYEIVPNKLYLSEVDNIFKYTPSTIYTVSSGQILNMAMVTKALSTGQFGQFPLYVFTTEGIWAMDTAADGTFTSAVPVSRDVCANPDMVVSLDSAIVFLTEKGMMLLTGSDIADISPDMKGKPYVPDQGILDKLENSSLWAGYSDVFHDATRFTDFMKDAGGAYDCEGQRIIFFNPDVKYKYQYVYMIATGTWHKMQMHDVDYGNVCSIDSAVNSYPDCYVNAWVPRETAGSEYRFLNLSVRYNTSSGDVTAMPGIIITRPFDLGYPDVRKVIKNIRLRGQYDNSGEYRKVEYILEGSNDGVNFHIIRSLRHSSWKLFRLVVLSRLDRDETLSYVEVEFDTRFTNRLR